MASTSQNSEAEESFARRWSGVRPEARLQLETRDYSKANLSERLASTGVEVSEIFDRRADLSDAWIPGVEVMPRRVYQQQGRGYFSELTRLTEGVLGRTGLAPRQWATALMHRASAKGFHIHPPYVPTGQDPSEWFHSLYLGDEDNYEMRPYDREQWDVMFFLTSICEMILVDEREGLPRRVMRLTIHGDSMPTGNNAAVVIPPGVAHALLNTGNADLIMVYGTSTVFQPDWEGRIGSEVERCSLPSDWERYLAEGSSPALKE